nr:MAG TPA: hypothetical protein [Caudoviricetes sp.]
MPNNYYLCTKIVKSMAVDRNTKGQFEKGRAKTGVAE